MPDLPDENEWPSDTPIMAATRREDIELIEQLLATGTSANERGTANMTPLHLATWQRNLDIMILLLDNGADIEAIDDDKETPLYSAVASIGFTEKKYSERPLEPVVRLLLDVGARPDAFSCLYMTPAQLAKSSAQLTKSSKDFEIYNMLVEAEIKYYERNVSAPPVDKEWGTLKYRHVELKNAELNKRSGWHLPIFKLKQSDNAPLLGDSLFIELQRDEEMKSNEQIINDLLCKGIEKKRDQKFNEAEELYLTAISLDPSNVLGYYNLAKVFYLKANRNLAIINYLRSLHLSLLNQWRNYNNGYDQGLLSNLSESLMLQLKTKHEAAVFLPFQENITTHLGHAIIDLDREIINETHDSVFQERASKQTFDLMLECVSDYWFSLLGIPVFTTNHSKSTVYENLQKNTYDRVGYFYAINHLSWERLSCENNYDVRAIYEDNMHIPYPFAK